MARWPTTTNITDDMLFPLETKSVVLDVPMVTQCCEQSCAAASLESLLRFYAPGEGRPEGRYASIWQELSIENRRTQSERPGTHPQSILTWAEQRHFKAMLREENSNDGTALHWIQRCLFRGIPPLVCWSDWGGHWCVVIGYVSGGTGLPKNDTVVLMDPVESGQRLFVNAARFYSMWYDGQHFERVYYRPMVLISRDSELDKIFAEKGDDWIANYTI